MNENVAHIKYRSNISKFTYRDIENLQVYDRCIIETDEGLEHGHVVLFEDIEIVEIVDKTKESEPQKENETKQKKHSSKNITNYIIEKNNSVCTCGKNPESLICGCKVSPKNRLLKVIKILDKKDIEQCELNEKDSKEAYKICKSKVKEHDP